MSIDLLDGGTTATTGGSAQTFTRTSTPVTNGYEYADVSEADHLAREKVIITARNPAQQADGSWSKHKCKFQYVKPKTLADGTVSYMVSRTEIEYHPEATAAEVAELKEMNAQFNVDSEFDNTVNAGTLPE